MHQETVDNAKSGFAAIIGRPNVGKSTLLNVVLGRKVAIISDKPQTTRNQIRGIHTSGLGQIVFIDTPGIHKPQHKLGEYMVEAARRTLQGVDVMVYVVDASASYGRGEQFIMHHLEKVETPVILVINKIDLISRGALLEVIDEYRKKGNFAEIIPVSAVQGENIERLIEKIFDYLPAGPMYYPSEMDTDQPEMFVIAELVREKALRLTREEVPHSLAVTVEEMQPRNGELLYVRAVIYVERDSQKGILIGHQGQMLREIGKLAREDIQDLLGSRVYLDLWVKVRKDWRDNEKYLRSFGYNSRDLE